MFKYEFKLTESQSLRMVKARDEMLKQNQKPGILFLQVTESLERAFGYFVPHEIACEVNEILSDWLIMEREKGGD